MGREARDKCEFFAFAVKGHRRPLPWNDCIQSHLRGLVPILPAFRDIDNARRARPPGLTSRPPQHTGKFKVQTFHERDMPRRAWTLSACAPGHSRATVRRESRDGMGGASAAQPKVFEIRVAFLFRLRSHGHGHDRGRREGGSAYTYKNHPRQPA